VLRRGFWFAMGLGFGTTAAVILTQRVDRAVRAVTPSNLSRRAADGAHDLAADVRDALEEGRWAMRETEFFLVEGNPAPPVGS